MQSLLDNSIFTTGDDGDITDILLDISTSAVNVSASDEQESSSGQQFTNLHFMDKSDLLIKLSRIIFEDFHNHLLPLNSKSQGDLQKSQREENFLDIVQKYHDICEYGVKGVEKVCFDAGHVDAHSRILLDQLTLERAAYALVLRMLSANKLLTENSDLVSTSILTKIFRENEEYRRISTLLIWSENCAVFSSTEFSRLADEDANKLSELDNIYACTKIRAPVHIDSRFVDRIAAEDEEAVQALNRILFALLRTGRLDDAKALLDNVGLPAMSAFITMREFMVDQQLSPLNRLEDQFYLAGSRLHFKQTARELIPIDDERIQRTDQCIWATLGSHLPTLLTHAQCSEDRLWAFLSCATNHLLDEALAVEHGKTDEQINLMSMDLDKEGEDLPRDVHSIFTQLRINEKSPYYTIFEHLALEQWKAAAKSIDLYVQSKEKETVRAHELRFFMHLLLLLKLTGQAIDVGIMDRLVKQYTELLVDMKLFAIVPLYFFHLSEGKAKEKMLDFLAEITIEPEQKEVLQNALSVGFDVADLCRETFKRIKAKIRIDGNKSEHQIQRTAEELLRAWKWLTYCGQETIWDAIVEANYLLRKLFLHNRMTEAMELMRMTPENLAFAALDAFSNEYPEMGVPQKLLDAKHEFECYQFYFEAINRYSEWQKQMEGGHAPEMPQKLSDERWARMDIRKRTEYELSVKKARDCVSKYYKLVELFKKRAIEMLESVLKMSDGWLVTLPLSDDSDDPELVERAKDFVEIRKHYLANLLDLLVDIHSRSNEPMRVLDVGALIVDPRYCLHKALSKEKLRNLLTSISKSGAALL